MSRLLDDVVGELSRLPGVGRRTALRLAMHMLRMEVQDVELMAGAISRFRREIHYCSHCNNLSDRDICDICADETRDRTIVCVVEQVKDLLSIENTRQYNGLYHVLGGVISALNVLCSKGDNVLLHSPTYIGFTHCLTDNGYHIVHSPLTKDEQGVWRMDFADMEKKIVENHIHAAIFCSPHNPCGRVWERWEIEQAMALYKKYDVMVVSDEIWSDILLTGYCHIPTQSVSEDAKMRTVALYAPSKTFNLAGLVGSYHIIYNSWLRDRCDKEGSLSHYNAMNVMSMHALLGAYRPEGYEWVEELRQVITGNVDFACDYIAKHFDGVEVSRPQGTYMLFLDCGEWLTAHGKTMDELLAAGWDVGVIWQDGRAFHGQTHIRMNLALPLSRVQEAFRRLDTYVFNA
mgnify:CR=1 FL=1